MHPELEPVDAIVQRLRDRIGEPPTTALVLGSGLGPVLDAMSVQDRVPYDEVGFPMTSVAGHAGSYASATLSGHRFGVLSGRVHLYEGLGAQKVVRAVRAMSRWGVQQVLLTCSVGGIRDRLRPGHLVLVEDHLNLQHANPLTGPAFGSRRFPDLTAAYSPPLRHALTEAGRRASVELHHGVLAAMQGPAYETPAEVRMLRHLGADIVGMSTVPEVMALAELGTPAAVVAVVSNRAAGLQDGPLTHDEVTEAAGLAATRLVTLLTAFCENP